MIYRVPLKKHKSFR
ncbi:MAG: hypothetical protein EB053_07410 [Chlamydiae bacterium]|nr:hypothetical protein [Chlamydiota bacterium]